MDQPQPAHTAIKAAHRYLRWAINVCPSIPHKHPVSSKHWHETDRIPRRIEEYSNNIQFYRKFANEFYEFYVHFMLKHKHEQA